MLKIFSLVISIDYMRRGIKEAESKYRMRRERNGGLWDLCTCSNNFFGPPNKWSLHWDINSCSIIAYYVCYPFTLILYLFEVLLYLAFGPTFVYWNTCLLLLFSMFNNTSWEIMSSIFMLLGCKWSSQCHIASWYIPLSEKDAHVWLFHSSPCHITGMISQWSY